MRHEQPVIQQRLHDVGLAQIAPALGFLALGYMGHHPAFEFDKRLGRNRAHQGHAPGGRDNHMVEAWRVGQHRRAHGLHGPQVVLVAGETEGMRVITFRLAAQKVHLESLGIDGGLVVPLLAHKRGVGALQHAQHGGVEPLQIIDILTALKRR